MTEITVQVKDPMDSRVGTSRVVSGVRVKFVLWPGDIEYRPDAADGSAVSKRPYHFRRRTFSTVELAVKAYISAIEADGD